MKFLQQLEQLEEDLRDLSQPLAVEAARLVVAFLADPNPHRLLELEQQLSSQLRAFGAGVVETAVNGVEPESAGEMPQQVEYEGSDFRLPRGHKTPNRHVATMASSFAV